MRGSGASEVPAVAKGTSCKFWCSAERSPSRSSQRTCQFVCRSDPSLPCALDLSSSFLAPLTVRMILGNLERAGSEGFGIFSWKSRFCSRDADFVIFVLDLFDSRFRGPIFLVVPITVARGACGCARRSRSVECVVPPAPDGCIGLPSPKVPSPCRRPLRTGELSRRGRRRVPFLRRILQQLFQDFGRESEILKF